MKSMGNTKTYDELPSDPDTNKIIKRIDNWNLGAMVLHFCSSAAIWRLSNNPWKVYLTRAVTEWKPLHGKSGSCSDVPCFIGVTHVTVGSISLEGMVVAFHAMSCVAHFYNWRNKDTYHVWLGKKMNPGRWVEYFFSASLMQVVIQVLCGFYDIWTLTLCAVCIAVTQLFGHATEQFLHHSKGEQDPRENWQFFIFGWISFIVPWVGVYFNFYDSVPRSEPGPPTWVKYIVWTLFAAFASFAFVMFLFLKNYTDKNAMYTAELRYIGLSLFAKTILAWQLFAGAFVRSSKDIIAWDPSHASTLLLQQTPGTG